MATHAHSTTAPALQPRLLSLAPFTFRPLPPVDDPRTAVEILDEIRRIIEGQVSRQVAGKPEVPPEDLLPATLPSLTSALSRRAAIFGGHNG